MDGLWIIGAGFAGQMLFLSLYQSRSPDCSLRDHHRLKAHTRQLHICHNSLRHRLCSALLLQCFDWLSLPPSTEWKNEYQLLGWVITIYSNGGCGWWQPLLADSRSKLVGLVWHLAVIYQTNQVNSRNGCVHYDSAINNVVTFLSCLTPTAAVTHWYLSFINSLTDSGGKGCFAFCGRYLMPVSTQKYGCWTVDDANYL